MLGLQKAQRNRADVIKKKCVKGESVLAKHERLVRRDNKELVSSPSKEMLEQLYVHHIMRPLLGPKHVDTGYEGFACKGGVFHAALQAWLFSFLINTLDLDLEPSQCVTSVIMTAIQLVVTATSRNSHLNARHAAKKGIESQENTCGEGMGYFTR
ncbi:hypothetical protein Q3G72_035213 [Acer saccharum]|nr:hypothetical protein Q3G72_035213 [Acer saccharum]